MCVYFGWWKPQDQHGGRFNSLKSHPLICVIFCVDWVRFSPHFGWLKLVDWNPSSNQLKSLSHVQLKPKFASVLRCLKNILFNDFNAYPYYYETSTLSTYVSQRLGEDDGRTAFSAHGEDVGSPRGRFLFQPENWRSTGGLSRKTKGS